MTKNKLYNRTKRELKKRFPKQEIKKMKFSYKFLNYLFDNYHLKEFSESYYDEQEDFCNWVEVEGESYGWVWAGVKESKRREHLRKYVLKVLHDKNLKKELYNRNIFYVEYNNFIWVEIPLLDVKSYNLGIIFTKDEKRLNLFG